jgi:excinuclease UvrABC ATPase subunit
MQGDYTSEDIRPEYGVLVRLGKSLPAAFKVKERVMKKQAFEGWQPCSCCQGTGRVMKYPYFSTQMPRLQAMPCEKCNGSGRVYVVPDNAVIEIESRYIVSTGKEPRK